MSEKNEVPLLTADDATAWRYDPDCGSPHFGFNERMVAISDGRAVVISAERLAELERDAARLDWLDSCEEVHGICHMSYGDFRHYINIGFGDARSVIDQAIAGEKT